MKSYLAIVIKQTKKGSILNTYNQWNLLHRGDTYTFSVSGHQWEWLFCAFLSELFLTPRLENAKQGNNCNISLMHINMDKMYANIVTYNL